jgi:hypothetical protein
MVYMVPMDLRGSYSYSSSLKKDRDHSFESILTWIWMRGECDEFNGFYEV